MFAFLGIGTQEIVLLALLGAMAAGAVLVAMYVSRSSSRSSSDRIRDLEEENRRLRRELDRDRSKQG